MENNNEINNNEINNKANTIISQNLLDILACPACKTSVQLTEYKPQTHGLKCSTCKRIYPIRDGIPVMLMDEAIPAE